MSEKIINTFIVPTFNYDGVRKTLESIHKHTPPNFNIILIDQCKEYRKDLDDLVDLHLYTNGIHLGFAKSMNMGIRLSSTEYVSCWNDDAECINPKWWGGIEETFNRYSTALGVNPSSPRNPRASGDIPVNHPGFEYKEDWTEEDYDRMVTEIGKGHIIDGICTFATVFNRNKLDMVAGSIPGKCWFDEYFYPGGGEDYDMNRRGYMTKIKENDFGGYRMLGTGLSFVWHWWYSTKRPSDGIAGVKHCGSQWTDKWGNDPDIYGRRGNQLIPNNKIRSLEECNRY